MVKEKVIIPGEDLSLARQLRLRPKRKEKKRNLVYERKILGLVLSITVGASFFFWLAASLAKGTISFKKEISLPSLPEIPSLSVGKKTIKKEPEKLALKLEPLLITESSRWGIWVEELEGDFLWNTQPEKQFTAASLIKLPVVATLYKQIEQGNLNLADEIVIKEEDVYSGAGSASAGPAGTKVSLERLAYLSLNQSDNTSFRALRRILGDKAIDDFITALGMKNTSLANNLTSPADMAIFFRQLYKGEIFPDPYKEAFLSGLTKTAFENRISRGVPEGMKVAHKIGTETRAIADAGIVFVPQKPILLVFLSDDVESQPAEEKIVQLTYEIYWFLVSSDEEN